MKVVKAYIKKEIEFFLINIKEKKKFNFDIKIKKRDINITFSDIYLDMKLEKIKKDPIGYAESCDQKELENILVLLNNAYHNNTSLVSDEIYDLLAEYLDETYKSEISNNIGAEISVSKKKVQLPTHLPSMEKIKPDTSSLTNWLHNYPGNKIISDKLDGMSLLIDARSKFVKAYTRGNGSIGQDISWIVKYLNLGTINNCMVRGECIVSKKNWEIIKNDYPEYSNPRNFVSGYTGRKNISDSLMKYIDFVAYEYIGEKPIKIESQLKKLEEFGINVVNYSIYDNISNNILSNILSDRRNNSEYEVDGIIITDNIPHPRETSEKYPKYAKAFKMILDDQTAEVLVKGITWESSIYGILNPIVNLSKINLDGVNISNATGYNANFIINNKIGGIIGPGSIVKLTRSGGVIPKIIQVVKPFKGNISEVLPDPTIYEGGYKWSDSKIDLILNEPDKIEKIKIKRIQHFFGNLGVPFFKEGLINKVYNAGFITISSMLQLNKSDLLKIDGFKEVSSEKILIEISKHYKKASLSDIMAAHYSFGSGFGKKKIQPIIDEYPNILDIDIKDMKCKQKLINDISNLPGYQIKTAEKFVNGLLAFKEFYNTISTINNDINNDINNNENNIKIVSTKLLGRVFCPTGFRINSELEKLIISNSGKLENTIKSNVTDLIVKDNNSLSSSKCNKAKEKKINIILKDEFITSLNI